jgi:hypothetical protein
MSIETMKLALEALNVYACKAEHKRTHADNCQAEEAITALRQAIEQAQKPVACVTYKEVTDTMNKLWAGTLEQVQIAEEMNNKKLYTAPPQRQWVGLTNEEEIKLAQDSMGKSRHWLVAQVEAKLKEKNT